MKISIKTLWDDSVIFEHTCAGNTVANTVAIAVAQGVSLHDEALMKTPLQINGLMWHVSIAGKYLTIGCQRHLIEDWRGFDNVTIDKMDNKYALPFWHKNKTAIMAICDAHNME